MPYQSLSSWSRNRLQCIQEACLKQRFRRGTRPSKMVTCVQETPPRNVFKRPVLTKVHMRNNKIRFQEMCRRIIRNMFRDSSWQNSNITRKPVQETSSPNVLEACSRNLLCENNEGSGLS